jgi:hypothetical protein
MSSGDLRELVGEMEGVEIIIGELLTNLLFFSPLILLL